MDKITHNQWCLTVAALVAAVVVLPFGVHAQIVISEIMYDYPGTEGTGDHDWIEVFNSGSTSVSLSDWRFREANTDHTITPYPEGAVETLAPGAYAVIANKPDTFQSDTGYTGPLFDSSFNLSSSGEILIMRCCGSKVDERTDKDTIIYAPVESATNNGNSLHRTSALATSFGAGSPTPGSGALIAEGGTDGETEETEETTEETEENQATAATASTSSSQATTILAVAMNGSTFPVEPQVFAYAGKNMTVIVGADVELTGRAFKKTGEPIETNVRFVWNFGDGSMKEGDKVLHHWSHPGKYIVVLDISQNKYAASHSIVVTAEPAALSLDTLSDGSVELINGSKRTIDISGWHIRSGSKLFTVPASSLLLAGARVAYSIEATGITMLVFPVELLYPNGVVAFREGESPQVTVASVPSTIVVNTPLEQKRREGAISGNKQAGADNDEAFETGAYLREVSETARASGSPADLQTAAAATSDIPWVWTVGFAAFVGFSGGLAIWINRTKKRSWSIVEGTDNSL